MNGDTFNRALAGGRFLVGVTSLTAPGRAFEGAGLSAKRNPQIPFMVRMFGVRDSALGLGAVTTDGAERRRWLQIGVACDAVDALAALAGYRGGYLTGRGALMVGIPAVAATAAGIAAMAGE